MVNTIYSSINGGKTKRYVNRKGQIVSVFESAAGEEHTIIDNQNGTGIMVYEDFLGSIFIEYLTFPSTIIETIQSIASYSELTDNEKSKIIYSLNKIMEKGE